ncbi:MAG TPA: hypothetical protein QF409_10335, partial [Acidimicrobiales bacterium]|nr:hypothetical protein [Acidimicrobiales bacterium]
MTLRGYWMLTSDDRLMHFHDAVSELFIDLTTRPVAIATTRDGQGCLVLEANGHIQGFGTARVLGDLRALNLVAPPVDIVASPTGVGYWVIDLEGSVFSFGSAAFLDGVPQVAE